MNIKKILAPAATLTSVVCAAATPLVTSVTMTQPGPTRLVNIDYTFTGADAVITLDVQTNAPGGVWASIGGAAVCNAQGEVWKKVTNDGSTHHITWRPDLSWPDHVIADGGARAVITAWTLDNTPDYMAVDISATGGEGKQTYYPSADFVPGGVTNNSIYKTSTLLMRKIMAKDVTWTMGSVTEVKRAEREEIHEVTLTNNYYIAVFEITQSQWQYFTGYNPSRFKNAMRPVENVCYADIRQGKGTVYAAASATGGVYPDSPYGESFLGLLRDKTNLDFDLPSEAQWEFAARAGNGDGYWGDGSIMSVDQYVTDAGIKLLARCYKNPNSNDTSGSGSEDPSVSGTAIVGSYKPNTWGLYDMHGNVKEWCLDWRKDDISALNGAVNATQGDSDGRLQKGGSWATSWYYCRAACRSASGPTVRIVNTNGDAGFRVVCTAGLQ